MSWSVWIDAKERPPCGCCGGRATLECRCCWTLICASCGDRMPSSHIWDANLNYTSNTSNMLSTAARALDLVPQHDSAGDAFDGQPSHDIGVKLRACIAWMRSHADALRAMNPANGFGHYDHYVEKFLEPWAAACEAHDGIVRINR